MKQLFALSFAVLVSFAALVSFTVGVSRAVAVAQTPSFDVATRQTASKQVSLRFVAQDPSQGVFVSILL